jgi:nicotinamide-nucleotide amidase
MTGGLGPTNDDITKITLAEFFQVGFVHNKDVMENIRRILKHREVEFAEKNSPQADVPENCLVLQNKYGTAPGMLFQINNKVLVSLPGVPFEMRALVTDELIPWIQRKYDLSEIKHKTFLTTGVPESTMAERLESFEKELPTDVLFAYLPSPGILRLRLSYSTGSVHTSKADFEVQCKKLEKLLANDLFGYDNDKLESIVGSMLKTNKATLATAESCSGGKIAEMITSIPGASEYFKGGIVAYSNDIKKEMLQVSDSVLRQYGAVSKAVVLQMAKGAKERFNTDYAIATSGIAGPTGGSKEKPVGTVWLAVASPRTTLALKINFDGHRQRTILRSSIAALNLLRLEINKNVKKTVEKV